MANGYNNVCIYKLDNTHFNIRVFNATTLTSDYQGIYYTGTYKTIQWSGSWGSIYGPYNATNSSIDGGYCYKSTTGQENSLWGMALLGQIPTGQLPNTFVGNQAIPQWEYLEYVNVIDNTTYNGSLFTYYFQGNLYSQARMKIGTIHPYDSYYYEINLINNSNNIKVGQCFVSEDSYNPFSSGALYIDEHHDLYVNTINVDYSTQYRLEITSYYGDGGDDLFEDIDWYIFLPQNAVVDSNSISSFGSGDYSVKDNTIAIVGALEENQQKQQDFLTDSSEVNNELDSFFSGDTDAIVSNLNFPNLNNNYFVVIYNVVSGITDTLQMSGDPYFDVQLHGETPKRIYASDFTTPNGVLKNFVSMALVFGTLYILYLQLSGFITMLNTGHIKDAINQIDDISGYTIYKM